MTDDDRQIEEIRARVTTHAFFIAPEVQFLVAKLDEARDALKFYANPWTWARVSADAQHMGAEPGFNFNNMYGKIARDVVGEQSTEF